MPEPRALNSGSAERICPDGFDRSEVALPPAFFQLAVEALKALICVLVLLLRRQTLGEQGVLVSAYACAYAGNIRWQHMAEMLDSSIVCEDPEGLGSATQASVLCSARHGHVMGSCDDLGDLDEQKWPQASSGGFLPNLRCGLSAVVWNGWWHTATWPLLALHIFILRSSTQYDLFI